MTKAPLWRFAEETPSGSQTQLESQTATIQGQPITITQAKPSGSEIQAPAQAQPQAPAQTRPTAQPPRLSPTYFPEPQSC